MSKATIIGAYNTKFGNFVNKNKETGEVNDLYSIYDLMIEAGKGALADAQISAKDIDAVWLGTCASGLFTNQEHLAAAALAIDPEALRFKPMTRCEDACASGSVALFDAIYAIEAGRVNTALVIGVEKMNLLETKGVTHALATCSYWPEEGGKGMTFPGLFAEYAKGYMSYYNYASVLLAQMLASISALEYKNGLDNPLAHFGKGGPSDRLGLTSAEAILNLPPEKNPIVANPLRLHDCSLVSDGAAALVIMKSADTTSKRDRSVRIAGIGHANEYMPLSMRTNMYKLLAGQEAAHKAFTEARISMADIDIAEIHDCFTINQILCTEALGLSKEGRAGFDYMEGRFGRDDPKCCVNLSGGLKAKGHPVGATGVSMNALLYKQLIGEPIGAFPTNRQPMIGVSLNVGGSSVTNCVTVLVRD